MKSVVSTRARSFTPPSRLAPLVAWAAITLTGLVSSPAQLAISFTRVATLGAGPYVSDLAVGQLNARGDFIFAALTDHCLETTNMPAGLCEGVFFSRDGRVLQIVAAGDPAPGGGEFAGSVLGPTTVNAQGDAAMALLLAPFTQPIGVNAGIYRYSSASHTLSGLVIPDFTSLPGSARKKFRGVTQGISINAFGTIAFPGIIDTTAGLPGTSLGVGVYRVEHSGRTAKVMAPGDRAPGARIFDHGQRASINDFGDVAFEGHLAGAEIIGGNDPSTSLDVEATGVYLLRARATRAVKIAQQGDRDPAGALFRHAFSPAINNGGQILFVGDLTPAPAYNQALGLYRFNGLTLTAVIRPGDALPGGGTLKTIQDLGTARAQNQRGSVCFSAELDNGDHGIYLLTPGRGLQLVAKTGTQLAGIGTLASVGSGLGGPAINDLDQLMFVATLTSGETVLLISSRPPASATAIRPARTSRFSGAVE